MRKEQTAKETQDGQESLEGLLAANLNKVGIPT